MKTRAFALAVLLCMPFGLFAQKQEEISPAATQQDIQQLQKDINAQRQEQKKANNRFADGLKGVAGSVEKLGKDTRDTKNAINGAEKNLGDKIDGVKKQSEEQTDLLKDVGKGISRTNMVLEIGLAVVLLALAVFATMHRLDKKHEMAKRAVIVSHVDPERARTIAQESEYAALHDNPKPAEIVRHHELTGWLTFIVKYIVQPENLLAIGTVNVTVKENHEKIFQIQFPGVPPCALDKAIKTARRSLGLPSRPPTLNGPDSESKYLN